jgi:diketogulonate reductase-like aldo/keto reductase
MREESWRALCDVREELGGKEGKLRSIGVSNFGVRHLQEILELGLEVPAVNQVCLFSFLSSLVINTNAE